MPIETSHSIPGQGISGLRPVGTVDARVVRTGAGVKDQTTSAASSPSATQSATFQPSTALDPGSAPVDAERVQVIRHAIQTGTYPVIPTKIADAMIAAGMLLGTAQSSQSGATP